VCRSLSLYREMCDDPLNNLCCGAGGGAWAMPYDEERLGYGSMKASQIKDTGAEIVIAPCHNCRDQILKGLGGEFKKGTPGFDMGNYHETLYLWELVANTLVVEPWSEAEIEAAYAARDAQFERDGIELEEEEEE
jgi:dimethylglycine catabolism B